MLREYPMAFARAVADMAEDIKRTSCGLPRGTSANGFTPQAVVTFQMHWAMDKSLWESAKIGELFSYLRKHKNIRIPEAWKQFVPRTLDSTPLSFEEA